MPLHLRAMPWGLLVAVLAAVAEGATLRGHLRNVSHGIGAINTSIPRGGGRAVCDSWAHAALREDRMKPYIEHISGGSVPTQGVYEELDRICGLGSGVSPMEDPEAYKALHTYIQKNRKTAPHSPFTPGYYSGQAEEVKALLPKPFPQDVRVLDYGCGDGFMLTVFHRKLGVPAENLHCIEVNDLVPKERRADFKLHILKDPISDLERLSNGPLKGYFDVASSYAVFHHIPDTAVRASAFSSIALMLKPEATFLLADWGSFGKPRFDVWYDVAHVFLWLFMGSAPPAGPVDIGTRYEGLSTYIELAGKVKLFPQKEHSSSRADMDTSPLGTFAQVFKKSSIPIGALVNSDQGNATHDEGLTYAMPLG